MKHLQIVVFGLVLFVFTAACLAEEFPFRKSYPDVPVIAIEKVKAGYDDGSMLLVDVRTKMEYETIHPRNAVHIDFSNMDFLTNLQAFAEKNNDKTIVVYDNGITCLKCYIAVQDAMDEELSNVLAFDGGVSAWAEAYPSATRLMGKDIVDPAKQLIPLDQYKKACLDFDAFKAKASSASNAVVIDARDAIQRKKKLPGFESALHVSMDKLINNIIAKGNMKDKQLLIFDQVGRQARWLMYYLVANGYTDYYFLDGGVTSVLQEQQYR